MWYFELIVAIAKPILYLICAIIIAILSMDLLSYIRYLQKYKNQGINYKYFPIFGLSHFLKKEESSKKDQLMDYNNYFKKLREPIFFVNSFMRRKATLYLTDPKLIKDLFAVDTEVSKRFSFDDKLILSQSFIYHSDHRALHLRSVMAEIFVPGNMKNLAPILEGKVKEMIEAVKDKSSTEGFTTLVLNDFIDEFFTKAMCTLLFGIEKKELLEIPKLTENSLVSFLKASFSILNLLSFGIAREKLLIKEAKEAKDLEIEVKGRLRALIKKRNEKGYKLRNDNVLDLIIIANNKSEEEGRQGDVINTEEIIDNILTVVFAGTDTSRLITKASLHYLGELPEIRGKIEEAINSINDKNDSLRFEECSPLINFVSEVLRLRNPLGSFLTRITTKNFKLGKYRIYKGEQIEIPMASLHRREEFFPNPDKFDIERHSEENYRKRDKASYAPFGMGKRNCFGKYLGLLLIKIIVGNFMENFYFEKGEGIEAEWVTRMTHGLNDCKVRIKIKK